MRLRCQPGRETERSGAERPGWHHHGLRRRWAIAQAAVRTQPIVMIGPPAGDAAELFEAGEDLAVEQIIAQTAIEPFDIAILPGAPGLDVQGGHAETAQPLPHRMSDELGTVVGPDILGWSMFDEQIGQHIDDVVRPEPTKRHHRQALPAELVDDVEHPALAAVLRLILDEVVGPHMAAMLRAQPDA